MRTIVLLLVLQAFAGVKAQVIVAPPQAVSLSYFGLHIHEADGTTPWPSVPFGSWRLWDALVNWPQIEPDRNRWDFRRLDHYEKLAQKHDVQLLVPLGLSPPWASARPTEPSAYGPGKAAEPRNLADWRRYVEVVARRYRGRIRSYEIWNEPDLPNFFSGSPEDMFLLAREAFVIIKRIDPEAILVSPSATGGDDGIRWLDRYLSLGGGQYADVIGYHLYVSPQPPEAALPVIRKVQQLMAKHSLSKPLWNTEAGWVMANREAKADPTEVGFDSKIEPLAEDMGAAYVSRSLILVWAAGVERNYWYAWDNRAMGLIEPKSKSLKPAARAYAQTARWLIGSAMDSCRTAQGGIWICALVESDGTRSHLVWRTTDSLRWAVPVAWGAVDCQALDGSRCAAGKPTVIDVGPAPVLLRGQMPQNNDPREDGHQ